MDNPKTWITPLIKQCFVTAGVSINFISHSMVVGFTTPLISQLKESETTRIDDDMLSWIVSINGLSLIIGTLMVPSIMNKYGRRTASITSAALMIIGWITIATFANPMMLLLARFIQGISMGLTSFMGAILIGEYTSPKYRGMLLTTLSVSLSLGILIVHALGTVLFWQRIALAGSMVGFLDFIINLYSPESPSFLVRKGRYEECRKVFHWLRGFGEEEELEKMIKTDIYRKANERVHIHDVGVSRLRRYLTYNLEILKQKEVYKSIIVMLHLFAMNQWCGGITFDSYAVDIIDAVVGKNHSFALIIISLDIQRTLSNVIAIIFIKKFRRRLTLVVTATLNSLCFLGIGLYVYIRTHRLVSFDYPIIGIILIHVHMCSVSMGSLPLTNIICGEIFPLEHRGMCGMLGILFFSINLTINVKTAPNLFSAIGVHGAYTVYGIIVLYCAIFPLCILPETKDKTLQDIEEEFRGEPIVAETNLTELSRENIN